MDVQQGKQSITVRLSKEMYETAQKRAEFHGQTVSEYIRNLIAADSGNSQASNLKQLIPPICRLSTAMNNIYTEQSENPDVKIAMEEMKAIWEILN